MSSTSRTRFDRTFRSALVAITLVAAGLLAFLAPMWAWPGRAGAAIQVGQLPPGAATIDCEPGNNLVQVTVSSGTSYEVPSPGGVITKWQHKGYSTGGFPSGSGRLQVWRPAGGVNVTLVGRSDLVPFTAGNLGGVVEDFPTRIPVSAGDLLGLRVDLGSSSLGCTFGPTDPGNTQGIETVGGGSTDPAVGETRTLTGVSEGRTNASATLEPDADGDGSGDESQDTPSIKLGGSKKQSSAKVVKVQVTCDIACAATATGSVSIPSVASARIATAAKVKKAKLKKSSAQIPAAGSVTLKLKLKKKGKNLLKQALNKGKEAKAKVKVTVAAGPNVSSKVRKITIK